MDYTANRSPRPAARASRRPLTGRAPARFAPLGTRIGKFKSSRSGPGSPGGDWRAGMTSARVIGRPGAHQSGDRFRRRRYSSARRLISAASSGATTSGNRGFHRPEGVQAVPGGADGQSSRASRHSPRTSPRSTSRSSPSRSVTTIRSGWPVRVSPPTCLYGLDNINPALHVEL